MTAAANTLELSAIFTRGFKIRRSSSNAGKPSVSSTLYACNVDERAYEWAEKGHGVCCKD